MTKRTNEHAADRIARIRRARIAATIAIVDA